MQGYFKILRLFLVLILGVFFLLGCGDDKPKKDDTKTDTSSQNEGTSNSDNLENDSNQNENSLDDLTISDNEDSTSANNNQNENNSNSVNIPIEKTEYHEVFAERTLVIDIDVPFELGSIEYLKRIEHKSCCRKTKIDKENKQFIYSPKGGFMGKEESKYKYWNKDKTNSVTITYKINVKKPLLEGNRDFSIFKSCQFKNTDLSFTSRYFDIDVFDNSLNTRIENIYNNKKLIIGTRNPLYSRIAVDYLSNSMNREIDEDSKRYYDAFRSNLDKMALVTCKYSGAYLRSILPINSNKWYAIKSGSYVLDAEFVKNDLLFYVSLLSELYTQIYIKEYASSFNKVDAIRRADIFMDKAFPYSHYKAEMRSPYYEENKLNQVDRLYGLFEKENKIYYVELKRLADLLTNGNIIKLIKKITNNYVSYYISSDKKCIDLAICGSLFPEFTESLTINSEFNDGLSSWTKEGKVKSIGYGNIDIFPTKNQVGIELRVDRGRNPEGERLDFDIQQIETLNNGSTIDDYFFDFDLDSVHGSSDTPFGGYTSSGFAGAYTCFRDSNNKQLGCLTWSDHLNKFFFFKVFGANTLENTNSFYNIELYPIVRRLKHVVEEGFVQRASLGIYLKKYLPDIYANKDIKYIEYGIFATEFQDKDNSCIQCIAKVVANKINLLKVK